MRRAEKFTFCSKYCRKRAVARDAKAAATGIQWESLLCKKNGFVFGQQRIKTTARNHYTVKIMSWKPNTANIVYKWTCAGAVIFPLEKQRNKKGKRALSLLGDDIFPLCEEFALKHYYCSMCLTIMIWLYCWVNTLLVNEGSLCGNSWWYVVLYIASTKKISTFFLGLWLHKNGALIYILTKYKILNILKIV